VAFFIVVLMICQGECRYAECRYGECRGAIGRSVFRNLSIEE
jgi:hypothetical protein